MTDEKPSESDLRAKLSDEQYYITQQKGTERAFTGKYVDHKGDGMYRCVCCSAELFSSDHKYDSGSGWPSFWLPLAGDAVKTIRDTSHGMIREEVVCTACGAHLGHVFVQALKVSDNLETAAGIGCDFFLQGVYVDQLYAIAVVLQFFKQC